MASPVKPKKPVPCPECGAAMDYISLPMTVDEKEPQVRLICPRCNHQQTD